MSLAVVLALAAPIAACSDDGANGGGGAPDAGPRADVAPIPGTWTARKALPIAKQEVAVVAASGKIYVIGGFDRERLVVPDVSIYDPNADAWTSGAALPTPLHHVNAAVVDGKIWVTGALEGVAFRATGSTIVYDPVAATWTPKASMPAGTERGASMTAAVGKIVYVAGGFRDGAAVAEFSAYDTERDSWTTLPPLSAARDHGAGLAVDGIFYAIGGRGGSIGAHVESVDAFDPAKGTWSPRTPMPTSRGGAAAAVAKGRIVVAGGEGNGNAATGVFAEVEAYDPASDTWTSLPPMKTPRHGTGAATIDGVVFVPGGGDRQAFAATDVVEALTF
jgi:N-acetylneuraminic acid mutarotase